MAAHVTEIRVGELYSNDQIQAALHVGNAGGIRVRLSKEKTPRRIVVLTSKPGVRQASENPYADRIEDGVLVYTGGGREGDQSLAGVNKRLPQQLTDDFPIYGFEIIRSRRSSKTDPKRWKFIGMLEYVRHYPDTQLDVKRTLRQVWVFEFRVHTDPVAIAPEHDQLIAEELLRQARQDSASESDEREISVVGSDGADSHTESDPVEIEAERSRLLAMPPDRFEHLIRDVLIVSGFSRVEVTRYSQDGGIDVNGFAGAGMWPIQNQLVQVQAKRWLHTVGRREVAQLRGSLQPFARGAIVTTSHFSKAAITESNDKGKTPIVLVDGYSFASLVRRYQQQLNSLD